MKLNVECKSCNKGKVYLSDGYDGMNDYYTLHCTDCENVFETHYTGMDCILEEHEYNNTVCENVRVLNSYGSWVFQETKKSGDFNLEVYTKGMKHIQTIEVYENIHYYQDKVNFYLITENTVHEEFEIAKYEAETEKIPVLMKHFFATA